MHRLVPTYHCQVDLPESCWRLLEVNPAPVAPAVLLLHPEEGEEGGGVAVHVELGPGHLPPVLPGPQLPRLLPGLPLLPEVEAVDWLPVAVFVPENYQNLVPGYAGGDVAGQVGHHAQHRLH